MISRENLRAVRRELALVRISWRQGRSDGFPVCCVAMFCWDTIWGLRPAMTRTVAQGIQPPDSACDFVPCGLLHHGGSRLRLPVRAWRLWVFWWRGLRSLRWDTGSQWLNRPWSHGPEDLRLRMQLRQFNRPTPAEVWYADGDVASTWQPVGREPVGLYEGGTDSAQLVLFPAPQVAIELFPFDYFVAADGEFERGCFRAAVRGLPACCGEGRTTADALVSLAAVLRPHALANEQGAPSEIEGLEPWVFRAARELEQGDLARWLEQWIEEPILGVAT